MVAPEPAPGKANRTAAGRPLVPGLPPSPSATRASRETPHQASAQPPAGELFIDTPAGPRQAREP
jgi:hypothetical protein